MNLHEGISRLANIISLLGWVALVASIVMAIKAAFEETLWALLGGPFVGLALFIAIQAVVWIIDGFLGNKGSETSIVWPGKKGYVRK